MWLFIMAPFLAIFVCMPFGVIVALPVAQMYGVGWGLAALAWGVLGVFLNNWVWFGKWKGR
jgi:hypothetical protein